MVLSFTDESGCSSYSVYSSESFFKINILVMSEAYFMRWSWDFFLNEEDA
jgi:hypothetical protein